jgi:hypothetical protein
MALHVSCSKRTSIYKTWEYLATKEVVDHYKSSISPKVKEYMHPLEEDVNLIRAYKEDEYVDMQVPDIVPNMSCTQNSDTKFHKTMELYWHTNTMVSQGILQKDQDYRQFKK